MAGIEYLDENGGAPGVRLRSQTTLSVLRRAFEQAGVEFLDEYGGGPGVRLRKLRTKTQ